MLWQDSQTFSGLSARVSFLCPDFFLLCSASTEFTSLFCSAAKGGRPSDKKSFERKKCRGACRHRYFFQDKGIAGTFTVWRTGLTLPKPKKTCTWSGQEEQGGRTKQGKRHGRKQVKEKALCVRDCREKPAT